MLYNAYVAICLASAGISNCDKLHNLDWVVAPEPQHGLGACMLHGQEYASQAHLAKDGELIKIYCKPVENTPDNQG